MENKVYQASKSGSLSFGTAYPVAIFAIVILIIGLIVVTGVNLQIVDSFPVLFILLVLLGLAINLLYKVNVWVEGNNLIIENKYKKEKREIVPLTVGLKLETEKKLRTNNKSNINLYNYLLHIKYNDGQEKKITLTFTKKQNRTNLCNDIASNSDIDTSKLDLSEETQKIASIGDIISIFKQAKSKTSGDVAKQSTSEQEVQKNDYPIPLSPTKPSANIDYKLPEILRAIFVILFIVVVVYYYIVYIK